MARYRLAHFSDVHFTVPPLRHLPRLFNKRFAGTVNYFFGGRGLRFRGVEHRIARLLEDVDAQHVDHALCTGDLTAIALDEEFAGCAALFGARLQDPARFTVLPGNHDRYVDEALAQRLFERRFGAVAGGGEGWPREKEILPGVTLVMLDVARPTPITHSSGLCGDEQRTRARALLAAPANRDRMVLLAMHYGLLRAHGGRDRPSHGIVDDVALMEMLDGDDVRLDLVLHGHMHGHFSVRTKRRLVHCAGSATDLAHDCGYNIYTLDTDTRSVSSERRCWSAEADAYVAAEGDA